MNLRIRELRKSRKMTMKQLGDELGFSEVTISQYETGKRQPNPEGLLKFSEFFGVSINYLVGSEDTYNDSSDHSSPELPDNHVQVLDPVRVEAMQVFDDIPESKKQAALDYLKFLASQK